MGGEERRLRLKDAHLYLCTDSRREQGDLEPFLDAVLAAVVDGRRLVHAVALAVHPEAGEPGTPHLLPERVVLLLPLALERGHDVELGALR